MTRTTSYGNVQKLLWSCQKYGVNLCVWFYVMNYSDCSKPPSYPPTLDLCVVSYLWLRFVAGEELGAIDPTICKAMDKQGQRNIQRLENETLKQQHSLEEVLCNSLSRHINLPPKWRRSACGALQCHAIEHHGAQCFVVETPCPRAAALFTKFDFHESEAKALAECVVAFVKDHDTIKKSFIQSINR